MTEKDLLTALATCFYINSEGGMEWRFVEDVSVADILGVAIDDEFKKYITE